MNKNKENFIVTIVSFISDSYDCYIDEVIGWIYQAFWQVANVSGIGQCCHETNYWLVPLVTLICYNFVMTSSCFLRRRTVLQCLERLVEAYKTSVPLKGQNISCTETLSSHWSLARMTDRVIPKKWQKSRKTRKTILLRSGVARQVSFICKRVNLIHERVNLKCKNL